MQLPLVLCLAKFASMAGVTGHLLNQDGKV